MVKAAHPLDHLPHRFLRVSGLGSSRAETAVHTSALPTIHAACSAAGQQRPAAEPAAKLAMRPTYHVKGGYSSVCQSVVTHL